jgi:protein-tyrosine phosphatase
MKKRLLFVCLGNICRSPLAEGVMRHLVRERGLEDRIEVDSAGTAAWHVGSPPDPRSAEVAARHGVSLVGQRARKVRPADFGNFDLLLAMDTENRQELFRIAPPEHARRVRLLRVYDPEGEGEVPDPYYGGEDGFELVYAMVHRSCAALLDELMAGSTR